MTSSSAERGAPSPQERLALSLLQIMQTLQSQHAEPDAAGASAGGT